MGSITDGFKEALRLQDVIEHIDDYDDELTIYAVPEWTPDSSAALAMEPPTGGVPAQARDAGMTYFLEVFIAKEVLEGLKDLDVHARTSRVIHYAKNDA